MIDSNFTNHKLLRDLDTRISDRHQIIATSDEALMRGFDFRAKVNGICLIVDNSFCTQRDADQALARVGREKDPCERYISKATNLIDNE